jgi:hypothetical protein
MTTDFKALDDGTLAMFRTQVRYRFSHYWHHLSIAEQWKEG